MDAKNYGVDYLSSLLHSILVLYKATNIRHSSMTKTVNRMATMNQCYDEINGNLHNVEIPCPKKTERLSRNY